MTRHFFSALVCLTLALGAAAQQAGDNRSRWTDEMLEAKHRLIIEQTGLTPSQQEQFMPLYEAMEKEIFRNNFDTRAVAQAVAKKGDAASDSEYLEAARAMSGVKAREGEIEARYFEQFAKILTKRQLFLLKQAESNFTRTMLRGRK